MLRCKSRYRNAALKIYVAPGEVLTEISAEVEAQLLRDSPESFEVITKAKGMDAPPFNKMVEREQAQRKGAERGKGEVMTSSNMQALVRPKR